MFYLFQLIYPANYNTNISEVVLSHAQQGSLAFIVTTPTYPNGYLYGMLPPLERNKCAQDSYVSYQHYITVNLSLSLIR